MIPHNAEYGHRARGSRSHDLYPILGAGLEFAAGNDRVPRVGSALSLVPPC